MTWKCAQIDCSPSKYFGTNYQTLKMWLNFSDLLKNNSFIKCFGANPGKKKKVYDWQDNVRSSLYTHFWWCYIWTTSPLVWSPCTTRTTLVRLGSIPGRVNFLKFEIFTFYDIFTCSGVYIDTFELNSSQPPWFGGCRRWINDLAVVGSIPWRAEFRDLINPWRRVQDGSGWDSGIANHWTLVWALECEL